MLIKQPHIKGKSKDEKLFEEARFRSHRREFGKLYSRCFYRYLGHVVQESKRDLGLEYRGSNALCTRVEYGKVLDTNDVDNWYDTQLYNRVRRTVLKNSKIESEFQELAKKWKKQTGHYSTMIHVTRNENYLRIIALGKPIIPFILKDMEKEPDYWFEALRILSNDNPVPKEHLGDLYKMTDDWLSWGRKKAII
jgi:hypothetical protein